MTKHQYRFRGAIQPSAQVKRPVRAEVVSDVQGGVGVLHLDDVIDSWGGSWGTSAREFNAALSELGDVSEIRLHINSPGGEVYEGIAIKNALLRHPARVTAVVDGLAASSASFIAASADELVMAPNTELMIHKAWALTLGDDDDHYANGDRLRDVSNNIASIYAKKAGGTVEQFFAAMKAETWYSAAEAVAAGLADRIEGEDGEPEPDLDAKNAFDLSVFKHAGRNEAPAPAMPIPPAAEPAPAVAAAEPVDDRRARMEQRRTARHARRAA